jgi:hypothetical protein
MKKTILISIILFCSFIAKAQEKKDIKDSILSTVSIGFNFSSTFENSNGNSGDFRYGLGFLTKINLNRNVNFNTGLSCDVLHDHINLTLDYYSTILHRTGDDYYSFINIPISFGFRINKYKFKPFIEIGMQGSILTENYYTSDDEIFHEKGQIFTNGSFCAFYNIGLGYIYEIKPKLDLIFNLYYYHTFIPLSYQYTNLIGEIENYNYSLYYYKASIGLLFHFNK